MTCWLPKILLIRVPVESRSGVTEGAGGAVAVVLLTLTPGSDGALTETGPAGGARGAGFGSASMPSDYGWTYVYLVSTDAGELGVRMTLGSVTDFCTMDESPVRMSCM